LACKATDKWNCSKMNVRGLFLQSISMIPLPSGKHNLELEFKNSNYLRTDLCEKITICDIVQCKILNWWSNDYPHKNFKS
jgi:hypothetical protein